MPHDKPFYADYADYMIKSYLRHQPTSPMSNFVDQAKCNAVHRVLEQITPSERAVVEIVHTTGERAYVMQLYAAQSGVTVGNQWKIYNKIRRRIAEERGLVIRREDT